MALYGISVFLVSAGILPGFQPSLCPALPTAKPLFMISPSPIGKPVPGCPLVSTRSIGTGLLEDSASYEVRSTRTYTGSYKYTDILSWYGAFMYSEDRTPGMYVPG